MKLPEFWSRAEARERDAKGRKHAFACWRWSDRSEADAHESAREAATRILRVILAGRPTDRYLYGQVPLREEVLQRITDDDGQLVAAVTQNHHGALVLNTDRVMFIDVDFPFLGPRRQLRYFFTRLIRWNLPPLDAEHEEAVRQKLAALVERDRDWSGRVYRTSAGMRVLVTHTLFDPAAEETVSLLQSVGSDPLYIQLCKLQQCFRARLTPKPWRLGLTEKMPTWPRQGPEEQARFEEWQADYAALQAPCATCRFMGTIGTAIVHPQAAMIIELHDTMTRCLEPLPLA